MDLIQSLVENAKKNQYEYSIGQSLKDYTSFKIGGKCIIMVNPKKVSDIMEIIFICNRFNTEYYVVGKGSNLLVNDKGVNKVIILMSNNFSDICLVDENTIECQAGASLTAVCKFALKHSLTGLEFAYGIPGTIGGAVFMNAGAYNGEMSMLELEVECIDNNAKVLNFTNQNLELSYRHSIFCDYNFVITRVRLRLKKGDYNQINFKMIELMGKRKSKQPLDYPSAGSTFKRPEGSFASKLIDECGLKGECSGGAKVSEKHAGFIINYNNAKSSDILELIESVKQKVFTETGYLLEDEIRYLE